MSDILASCLGGSLLAGSLYAIPFDGGMSVIGLILLSAWCSWT